MKSSASFPRSRAVLLALATLLGAASLPSDVAAQMNYQGRLTDASGNPLPDGQYTIEFRVFSGPTGDSGELWGPFTVANADLVAGRFNTIIGATDAFSRPLAAALSGTAYLQIKVGSQAPLSPRQQILAAPKALQADLATRALNADVADVATNALTANVANNFNPNGDLFINGSGFFGFDDGNLSPPEGFGVGVRVSTRFSVGRIQVSDFTPNAVGPFSLQLQGDGGNVLVGSTTNIGSLPFRLTVGGTIGTVGGNGITSSSSVIASSFMRVNAGGSGFLQNDGTREFQTFLNGSGVWVGANSNHPLLLQTSGSSKMVIGTDGRVSIGTGVNPTSLGMLNVSGTGSHTVGAYYNIISSGAAPLGAAFGFTAADVSIRASDNVHASGFRAYSDVRIKNVIGRSDAAADLATLTALEVTDYTHKDAIAKGAAASKKLVAQQVETVFPQAVSRTTDVIPDLYTLAPVNAGWIVLTTDLQPGERVQLIGPDAALTTEVVEVRPGAFRPSEFPEDTGADVFVFGREVTDFRTVDYEAIAMLNVSATQELHRQLRAKDEAIARLEARLTALEAALAR